MEKRNVFVGEKIAASWRISEWVLNIAETTLLRSQPNLLGIKFHLAHCIKVLQLSARVVRFLLPVHYTHHCDTWRFAHKSNPTLSHVIPSSRGPIVCALLTDKFYILLAFFFCIFLIRSGANLELARKKCFFLYISLKLHLKREVFTINLLCFD